MASELHVDTYPDATVYFQVRSATGTIWNTAGAALEAYATANIADYDIAGTEQGTSSGYYVGSMPAVAAGLYHIAAKVRLGGAPVESDPTVDMFDVDWDGSALVILNQIDAKTKNLPTDPADESLIIAATDALAVLIAALNDISAADVKTAIEAAGSHLALIKAKTDSLVFTVASQVDANIQYVNGVLVTGTGAVGDEWGP